MNNFIFTSMENPMIEKFMVEVFEKAKKDSGTMVRHALARHIEDRIQQILGIKINEAISARTLERCHIKYIEKQESAENFSAPSDRHKNQLAKYLGYENYHDYTAHIYRNDNHHNKTVINNADIITTVETLNGDLYIGKKDEK